MGNFKETSMKVLKGIALFVMLFFPLVAGIIAGDKGENGFEVFAGAVTAVEVVGLASYLILLDIKNRKED